MISHASEKGGHAQVTRRSPICIIRQPSRSISMKQSERASFCSITNCNSSLNASSDGLSQESPSTSSNLNSEMCPALTRGGHSAFRNTVDAVSSASSTSSDSGIEGWSPKAAMIDSVGPLPFTVGGWIFNHSRY